MDKAFVDLVAEMRELQREFFRAAAAGLDRSDLLHRCRLAEKAVDNAIKESRAADRQPALFDL